MSQGDVPDGDAPKAEAEDLDRLSKLDRAVKDALGKRAEAQRKADEREAQAQSAQRGGTAWRMVTNLVVSTAALSALGYWVDTVAATRPFGLIVGLFVGFGAGMWMAAQAAARMQAREDQAGSGDTPDLGK